MNIKTIPNVDNNTVTVIPEIKGSDFGDIVEVSVFDKGTLVSNAMAKNGLEMVLPVGNSKLWSPNLLFCMI
ncbi:hypothetical protein NYZ99_06140 [Maribacter litopenaei]|uniref:Uncharacterized protein n=1 Tax=Maribacter litopenaei TaxID=2976127 RepID=A0ABY5YA87_9FLAO|nr:hypothetical protein [Maribacter litopenaei]UWX55942.1 hypothetical protein NYZ99_06140 [Maribacter litopenaei]